MTITVADPLADAASLKSVLLYRRPGDPGDEATGRGYVVLEAMATAIAHVTDPPVNVEVTDLRDALDDFLT